MNSRLLHMSATLVLVDWENLFYSLFNSFGPEEAQIGYRLQKLMEWVKNDIGEIWGGYGFVFAPEHLSFAHQQLCVENGFKLIICPKRILQRPKINPKTEELVSEEDTVDETIMWFGQMMARHQDVKFVCLVTGDDDFVPFFEELERHGIKRALAPPAINSLSKTKRLIQLADRHPKTFKKMILRLDKL